MVDDGSQFAGRSRRKLLRRERLVEGESETGSCLVVCNTESKLVVCCPASPAADGSATELMIGLAEQSQTSVHGAPRVGCEAKERSCIALSFFRRDPWRRSFN